MGCEGQKIGTETQHPSPFFNRPGCEKCLLMIIVKIRKRTRSCKVVCVCVCALSQNIFRHTQLFLFLFNTTAGLFTKVSAEYLLYELNLDKSISRKCKCQNVFYASAPVFLHC